MAYQMSFTDQFGNEHPNAYFAVMNATIDPYNQTSSIIIGGFKDADAFANHLQPFATYTVVPTAEIFAANFSPIATNAFEAMYATVMATSMANMFQDATVVP